MSFEFYAELNPSKELCTEMADLTPTNPFYTSKYIEYRRLLGYQPLVFTLRQDSQLMLACTAFLKSHYTSRSLEIPSLSSLPDGDIFFWEGLLQFCRKTRVSSLLVDSYASAISASTSLTIPALPGEIKRRVRYEYVLELQQASPWNRLSSNHLRNIRRGHKAGLQVRRAVDEQACQEHAHLIRESMKRRKSRGESIPENTLNISAESFAAMTQSGSGELFQAALDGKALSSVLVLVSDQGGYYQSAGTSYEGMACGASHFLVYEIANTLQAQSMKLFNLGGTDRLNTGLIQFKSGFGATEVRLEAAEFFLGSKVHKGLRTIARSLRDNLVRFFQYQQRLLERVGIIPDNSPTPTSGKEV